MKGRTTCPQCKHEFVLDVPDNSKKYEASCPKCKNKFTIKTESCDPDSGEECYWEDSFIASNGVIHKEIIDKIKAFKK